MKAESIKGKNNEEVRSRLEEILRDGFSPTLAIVFMSVKQDRAALCELLSSHNIAVFGGTSAGEFIDGEIEEESIVMVLMDMPKDHFRVVFEETGNGTTRDAARRIGAAGKTFYDNPAFMVISGGVSADGEMVVRGIEDETGREVTIFGGQAGDDLNMTSTFAFTNNRESNNGLVALVINEDKIKIRGIATSGWKPVGTVRTVTKSDGNVVYTIDDNPALDLVFKYLGLSEADFANVNDALVNFGVYFPIQIQRENAPPVMRTAMLANLNDRSFICAGSVPEGSKIRFSLPPDFNIIDEVVNDCTQLKNDHIPEADAMVFFSCKARHLTMGPMISEEISAVKNVWNKPMAGYFCYGEIGKTRDGKHEFHNSTCCLVLLKEESMN